MDILRIHVYRNASLLYIIHMLYMGMYILGDTKLSLLRGVSAIEICISICQPLDCLLVYLFNIYMAVEYRFTSCTVLLFAITYRICVMD